ncbi:Hypothetical protein SCLAV_4046 [Streptomyces clavuligerus]|uniref:Uncharacterized protein n=1 Tax=Streptomyces clavuligerus TaxID=1901 RepID=E2Q4W1_STRCL|nr:Hypothetical protein SCLAV_4046 [Streptomyces clavuligerus]
MRTLTDDGPGAAVRTVGAAPRAENGVASVLPVRGRAPDTPTTSRISITPQDRRTT